jgi:hypothetical protein
MTTPSLNTIDEKKFLNKARKYNYIYLKYQKSWGDLLKKK